MQFAHGVGFCGSGRFCAVKTTAGNKSAPIAVEMKTSFHLNETSWWVGCSTRSGLRRVCEFVFTGIYTARIGDIDDIGDAAIAFNVNPLCCRCSVSPQARRLKGNPV
jgi:hypothetical protein